MSENLDLVRSIFAAWERGDYSSVDWAHPEIEYVFVGGPEPGTWTGVVVMANAWREFLSAWEDYGIEAVEYCELDDERVLVLSHSASGRGKLSGLEVGQVGEKGALAFHVRDGKVTRFVGYFDGDRALADLGLEEYAAMNLFASDIVFERGIEALEGRAALRGFVQDWLGAYEDYEQVVEELRDWATA